MTPADRLPPQNCEAEQGVIGSVLLEWEAMHDVADTVRPDHFYREAHQTMFAALADTYRDGRRADATVLAEELQSRGQLDRVGGIDYIGECIASVPHAAFALEYAQIVRDKAVARALLETCLGIMKDVYSNNYNAGQLVDRAQRAVLDVADTAAAGAAKLKTLKVALSNAIGMVRSRRDGTPMGVPSGLEDLDGMLAGFGNGTLTVVGARPGMGKSSLALNIAVHAATEARVPTLIFSMEMSDREWGERFLASYGDVNGYFMRHPGNLDQPGYDTLDRKMLDAYDRGGEAPIFLDDASGRTSMQIIAASRRAHARHGIGLVIVDYLQLCEADDDRDTRQEQVSKISRRLKVLARALDIPVIALSQLNRGPENREDKRPRKSDLRESGALEQDADNVLLLHITGDQMVLSPDVPVEAEIIVDKSRNGPTGIVKAFFHKQVTRFGPWYPPAVQNGPF